MDWISTTVVVAEVCREAESALWNIPTVSIPSMVAASGQQKHHGITSFQTVGLLLLLHCNWLIILFVCLLLLLSLFAFASVLGVFELGFCGDFVCLLFVY